MDIIDKDNLIQLASTLRSRHSMGPPFPDGIVTIDDYITGRFNFLALISFMDGVR